MNNTHILVPTITLAVVVAIVAIVWFTLTRQDPASVDENETHVIDTSTWVTYHNEAYNFSIQHPPDWEVAEYPDYSTGPAFNLHKPNQTDAELPYTHHTNADHVSVFPQGIPTEGVSGERAPSTVAFQVPTIEAFDYLLSDGDVFATYAVIGEATLDWNQSGFIVSNTVIEELEAECRRNDQVISSDQCDVLAGDTLIRHGTRDATVRATQEAMLASFRLIEPDPLSEVFDQLPYDMTVHGRTITFDHDTVDAADRGEYASLPYEVEIGDEVRLIESNIALQSGESPIAFVERFVTQQIPPAEELSMYPDTMYQYSVSFHPMDQSEVREYPATDDPTGPTAEDGLSAYVRSMNFPDDSIGGSETRFDFIISASGGWILVWHGERHFCRRPGNEFWQPANLLCP